MNLVDNSVQTQFAVLKKDTDAYRNAANAADRDRRREEEQLRVLQSSRIRLEEDIRVAHTELGTETRKKKILDDERKRLKDTMETDRQAIIKITSELKGIDADEKRQKINFVKEMESLNNELEFLLSQCENQKTLRLLDAETMNWMIETKLSQKVRSVQSDSDGPNVEDGSYFAEIEKWNVILSKTKNESEAFADAHQKHDASLKEKDELENLVHGLRIKFMAKNSVRITSVHRKTKIRIDLFFSHSTLLDTIWCNLCIYVEHWRN